MVAALVFFAALLSRFSSAPPFEPGSAARAREANARGDAFVVGVALPLALLAAIPFLRRDWSATARRRLGRCVDFGHQMTDAAMRRVRRRAVVDELNRTHAAGKEGLGSRGVDGQTRENPPSMILDLIEANARQLATRARRHIAEGRRTPVSASEQRRLFDAFMVAAQEGDIAGLEAMFADDVRSHSGGNGGRNVARKPVLGRAAVAKFVAMVRGRLWIGTTTQVVQANGLACFLVRRDGVPYALGTVHGSEGRIDCVTWIMSPQKLERISQSVGLTCQRDAQ